MKELRENRNLSLKPSASPSLTHSLYSFIGVCLCMSQNMALRFISQWTIWIEIISRTLPSDATWMNERSSTLLFVIEHLCMNGMRLIKRIFVNIKHHSADLNDKFLFSFSALDDKKNAHLQHLLISSSLFYAIRQFSCHFFFIFE